MAEITSIYQLCIPNLSGVFSIKGDSAFHRYRILVKFCQNSVFRMMNFI